MLKYTEQMTKVDRRTRDDIRAAEKRIIQPLQKYDR